MLIEALARMQNRDVAAVLVGSDQGRQDVLDRDGSFLVLEDGLQASISRARVLRPGDSRLGRGGSQPRRTRREFVPDRHECRNVQDG